MRAGMQQERAAIIKRITGALDPRGYEVHPIASPSTREDEKYLWSFCTEDSTNEQGNINDYFYVRPT